jgi:hypothetical protein
MSERMSLYVRGAFPDLSSEDDAVTIALPDLKALVMDPGDVDVEGVLIILAHVIQRVDVIEESKQPVGDFSPSFLPQRGLLLWKFVRHLSLTKPCHE